MAAVDAPRPGRRSRVRIQTDIRFARPQPAAGPAAVEIRNANLWYGEKQALFDIALDIPANQVTAFIGPSGCGKSTLLRCLNRMNDLIDGVRIEGRFASRAKTSTHRGQTSSTCARRIGMVFQKSNPLAKSIYENVVYGLRVAGIRNRAYPRRGVRACAARSRAVG